MICTARKIMFDQAERDGRGMWHKWGIRELHSCGVGKRPHGKSRRDMRGEY